MCANHTWVGMVLENGEPHCDVKVKFMTIKLPVTQSLCQTRLNLLSSYMLMLQIINPCVLDLAKIKQILYSLFLCLNRMLKKYFDTLSKIFLFFLQRIHDNC